jgi:uncharacterized protein (DUF1810 family)
MTTAPDLTRFRLAQDPVWSDVVAELRAGRKRTHWMWFVFPQIAGLGHSDMAKRFAIRDAREAGAYLADPVLGARLREGVALLLGHAGQDIRIILGSPDDLKLRSCLTLFEAVAESELDRVLFASALAGFHHDTRCVRTLAALGIAP